MLHHYFTGSGEGPTEYPTCEQEYADIRRRDKPRDSVKRKESTSGMHNRQACGKPIP